VLKRVLISVDLPKPDSPIEDSVKMRGEWEETRQRTNNHCSELETFADALPVHLVGKVGETNVAHELFANNRCNTSVV